MSQDCQAAEEQGQTSAWVYSVPITDSYIFGASRLRKSPDTTILRRSPISTQQFPVFNPINTSNNSSSNNGLDVAQANRRTTRRYVSPRLALSVRVTNKYQAVVLLLTSTACVALRSACLAAASPASARATSLHDSRTVSGSPTVRTDGALANAVQLSSHLCFTCGAAISDGVGLTCFRTASYILHKQLGMALLR